MLRGLVLGFLLCSSAAFVTASDAGFTHCNCDEDGSWSLHSILEFQKVSDFLIAVAYFSIPVELLYFLSCSSVPFKWVLLQVVAFIVLCGLTHLLNGWTYYGPHSFQLILALTISKFLTALVSCATAITLLTLIPLLLKVKVRELFLRQNVLELNQEVGIMKKQKEASWHVRMLTQEIRKSLDKHTILYTTLVELSKTLGLQNCAVWMPNKNSTEMNLTHELEPKASKDHRIPVPINDPDVLEIKKNKGVRILKSNSALGVASSGGYSEPGVVAAIRMPKLSFSNFKGGTPEMLETCYAILVLVLPVADPRVWSSSETEIVEVVADQVAVALSHADLLEESQLMREKLAERNHALQQAKKNAMMASHARNSFQKVMSHGMKRPMHSMLGLLSIIQEEHLNIDQRFLVDTLVKTSSVLSALICDVMETPGNENGRSLPEMRPFQLHSMIKEASCLVKCFCIFKGFGFSVDVQNSLPNHVVGDEKRTFQVILHMVGYLLNVYKGDGIVNFRVKLEGGSGGNTDGMWGVRIPGMSDDYVCIRFDIQIADKVSESDTLITSTHPLGRRYDSREVKGGLSFRLCRKIVKVMQGNIWISSNLQEQAQSMTLVLRFQISQLLAKANPEPGYILEKSDSSSLLRGVRVMLADDDDVNRTVTKKLLEKLGCCVAAVSSGFECLNYLGSAGTSYRILLLDLHMPGMNGFEVAMRIRKFWSPTWLLIIALTATAEDNVWERCLQHGMNGLIRKPVLLQGLAEELRRNLQRASEGV